VGRGGRDRLGEAAAAQAQLDGKRRPVGERLERRVEPPVGEHCGMDAARELAELFEGDRELTPGPRKQLFRGRWIGGELRLGEAERDRERDESLLGAVVEVALEPAPLLVSGGDKTGARRPQ